MRRDTCDERRDHHPHAAGQARLPTTRRLPSLTWVETADVVVVVGGSAGAVLAARLSKDPARTVLPLEAGHAYASDAYRTSLLDANKIADPDHDWGYTSRDMDQIPQIPTPRGCTTAAPKAPPTQTGNRYG